MILSSAAKFASKLAFGLSFAALSMQALAQTSAAIPPASYGNRQAGQFGDRTSGTFGDIDQGHYGDTASGNFREQNYSRAQEGQVRPVTAKPLPSTVSSPYITLSKPADEPVADSKPKTQKKK
eukprot:TRINITY_DN8659_c1_g1_i1.p1 TRINITY_DN8659_c1_g1~~TRINITY_DN8659_c1_g1_i1.p1  ORF type:complete len:123 (+),score=19.21 TRINITY_DN8659_c1_g1_i1:96-464(+)